MVLSNKFTQLLATLSLKELKRFADFLHSPYFNKNEEISLFGKYQIEAAIQKRLAEFTDEEAFGLIFPNEPYKRDKLYRLRSGCLVLLEQFIIYDQVNPKEGIHYLSLLYHYAQKDLHKHFAEGHEIWIEQKNQTKIRDANFYYFSYMEESLIRFYITKNRKREKNMTLSIESANLDAFSNMSILDNLSYLLTTSSILRKDISQENLVKKINETIHQIHKNPNLKHNILIQTYIVSLELQTTKNNEPTFIKMSKHLEENLKTLPQDILKNEYTRLINFCIKQTKEGKKNYYQILFDLYQIQLDNDLLYDEKKKITTSSFKNILTTALRIGQTKWAENFLETHKERLLSENPQMMYRYCQAKILFEQNKFTEAQKILLNVKLKDLLLSLDIRRMLIKSYYEMSEMQLVAIELEKFHVYVFRQKEIAEIQRERNKMFCNLVKRIIDYTPGEVKKKQKILLDMNEVQDVVDKEWLLQKIQALK
jgi:hypothetical protein